MTSTLEAMRVELTSDFLESVKSIDTISTISTDAGSSGFESALVSALDQNQCRSRRTQRQSFSAVFG